MSRSGFIGRGWSFPPSFHSPESGPVMVEAEEEIRQAIWILVSTGVGERPFHQGFGSGMADFMFESGDLGILADLQEDLSNAIIEYESRVDLENINIQFEDVAMGKLKVTIEYVIRETNTRSNLVYPFYLNELAS